MALSPPPTSVAVNSCSGGESIDCGNAKVKLVIVAAASSSFFSLGDDFAPTHTERKRPLVVTKGDSIFLQMLSEILKMLETKLQGNASCRLPRLVLNCEQRSGR